MLWRCFSAAGTKGLIWVEEKLNAPKYRDSLNKNPVQSLQIFRLGRKFTFQQDNGPKHTARVTYRQLSECPWVTQPQPCLEYFWKNQKMCVYPHPSWELKRWGKEWQIIAKCWCAKLVTSYPKYLGLKVLQLSTELRAWILMQCTCFIIIICLYKFTKLWQFCLCFAIMVYEV